MVVRNSCLFALLVALVGASIDCSVEDTCFGEPKDCNPDTSCKTLFHFDEQGNLDLYLRNFTEPMGYAAFSVKMNADKIFEYFICIPHEGQRLRALADLGDAVLVTEQNLTGVVEHLGAHNFRCHFDVVELPVEFQHGQVFFVSTGIFDEALVIVDGVQLYNLSSEYDDDEELDEEAILPTIEPDLQAMVQPEMHYISRSIETNHIPSEDVLTEEDEKTLTDAIREVHSLSEKEDDDFEMEMLARMGSDRHRQTKSKPKTPFVDADESVESDDSDRRRGPAKHGSKSARDQDQDESEGKDSITHHRRNQKPKVHFRHQEYDDIEEDTHSRRTSKKFKDSEDRRRPTSKSRLDDEEEEEDTEDEYTPRRTDHKSKRRQSEESRRRNSKSRNQDEDEDEEDSEVVDEYTPRRFDKKKSRPTRYEEDDDEEYVQKKGSTRRSRDDDMEDDESPRSRSNKKNNKKNVDQDDDYESDEDEEEEYNDDTDNASAHQISYIVIPVLLYGLM